MRILLSALSLLLLFSGCATVDGEPVASGSVAADAATWNPRAGHTDKKYQNAIEMIREGLKSGDTDLVKKAHRNLTDLILGEQTWGEWYADIYHNGGQHAYKAKSIAGDIVMREFGQLTGAGLPTVEEAARLGLIQPSELLLNCVRGSSLAPVYRCDSSRPSSTQETI